MRRGRREGYTLQVFFMWNLIIHMISHQIILFKNYCFLLIGKRGTSGPLYVEELNNSSPLATAFTEGAVSLGIAQGDLNGELESGVMVSQSMRPCHRYYNLIIICSHCLKHLSLMSIWFILCSWKWTICLEHAKSYAYLHALSQERPFDAISIARLCGYVGDVVVLRVHMHSVSKFFRTAINQLEKNFYFLTHC